jgi:hypothetical protein
MRQQSEDGLCHLGEQLRIPAQTGPPILIQTGPPIPIESGPPIPTETGPLILIQTGPLFTEFHNH